MVTLKNYSKYLNPYMESILENKVEHCKEQEQMINNLLIPVLEREDVYVDNDAIEDGLSLQKYFPFDLIEWEIFLFAVIVGIRYRESGNPYFTEIRILVGRGSGKNGFASFLCFYFISPKNGIKGYNVDLMANSEEQAKTSFDDVYEICTEPEPQNEKAIRGNFKPTKEKIFCTKTNSVLRFNTSSKKGKDSKRTGCVIFDELHEYDAGDQKNINTLSSGLGKIAHARIIKITTDGHTRGGVLDKEKDQNLDILSKYNPNNRIFVFWCRIENEKEGMNEDKWVKAVPSLRHKEFATLKEQIQKEVLEMPYKMDYYPEFMAKRMNFPVGNQEIEIATWDDILATNQEMAELNNLDCVGGIDYTKTNDFAGVVLLFKLNGKVYVKQHTFICSRSRDLKGIKAPLKEWAEKGDVEFIDEVEIPPELIAGWFERQREEFGFNILKIAIDSYRRALLAKALKEIGFDAFEEKNLILVRPSNIMQVIPVINSLFVNHNLVYGDVPVLRWMTNNVKKINTGNNIVYGKIEPHYRKTDTFMALAAAATLLEELEDDVGEIEFFEPLIF